MDIKKKREKKQIRARRTRRKIRKGGTLLPRLSVYKSNTRLYVQVIDDSVAKTLFSASSADKDIKGSTPMEKAVELGKKIAKLASDKKVEAVVFDRGSFAYMGKVKALAEAAREAGLKF